MGTAATFTSSSLELFLGHLKLLHHDFENLKELIEHEDGAVIASQTSTPATLKIRWMLMRNFLDFFDNQGEILSLELPIH